MIRSGRRSSLPPSAGTARADAPVDAQPLRTFDSRPGAPRVPRWLIAGLWGGLAGGALLLGAAAGYLAPVPRRIVAGVMAFGAGVLISALAFDLMDEALARGGFAWTAAGFLGGAVLYTGANWLLARRGAKHRKRSDGRQPSEADAPGSGVAIAVGALMDGIPESARSPWRPRWPWRRARFSPCSPTP